MTKEKLLEIFMLCNELYADNVSKERYDRLLKKLGLEYGDREVTHAKMDELLLEYINDKEITDAFNKVGKWYA